MFATLWAYLIAGLAGLAGLVGVLFAARKSGADSQKNKQAEVSLKAAEDRVRVDDEVRRKTEQQQAAELQQWEQRT
jgi:hypothetical protein